MSTPTPRRVAVASAVSATIEWYDFFLYGTAAAVVFDKLYFNGLDGAAAQFAAFGTFAVGFLARPVGGLVFGHFGDRLGRKQMLLLTLLSPVGPDDAPTRIRVGSHHDVARALGPDPVTGAAMGRLVDAASAARPVARTCVPCASARPSSSGPRRRAPGP